VTSGTRRVGAIGQVGALVRMRAGALHGPARRRAVTGLLALPVLLVLSGLAGTLLPDDGGLNARLLMPTAWLGFTLTAVLAAGTSGSRTLLPPAQTVIFPLTAGTEHLGALLLAPLNVAWVTQSLALLTLSTWGFGDPAGLLPGLVMTLAWIVTSTVLAQAVSWLVELARTTWFGPWLIRAVLVAGVATAAVVALTGRVGAILDRLPTVRFVAALGATDTGDQSRWPWLLLQLAGLSVVGYLVGLGLTARWQRRASRDQTRVESRNYPSRDDPRTELAAALRIDRAGVWRSAPLRRGLATLIAAPALAAAAAGLDWPLAVLLPGLVASGAGLLFGVNALSLDGSGAIWRESLPGSARTVLLARLLVITEVCLSAALLAAAIGAVRAPSAPSPAALIAVLGAVIATTAQVVGRCAGWSVNRPYAATLRDARDQPAPPAAMAGYSARLAISTTGTGLLFSLCARYDLALVAVAATVAISALALRRVVAALDRWDDHTLRSRVITTVAG
jgi:hypothetical protein